MTEPAVSGYIASYDACSNIVVGNGETKTCTITNNDNIPPTVDVQKTVRVAGSEDAYAETASAPEPGGTFQYNVVVWNKSKEAVTLTALTDTVGGVETSLDGQGTCDVPQSLAASDGASGGDDTYTCQFELTFNGNAGTSQVDTVKATVKDDENDTASDEDDASVSLTNVNPRSMCRRRSRRPTARPTSARQLPCRSRAGFHLQGGREEHLHCLERSIDDHVAHGRRVRRPDEVRARQPEDRVARTATR